MASCCSTATEEMTGKEKLVLSESCELVTTMLVIKGRLEVTTTHVYFFDCTPSKDEGTHDPRYVLQTGHSRANLAQQEGRYGCVCGVLPEDM